MTKQLPPTRIVLPLTLMAMVGLTVLKFHTSSTIVTSQSPPNVPESDPSLNSSANMGQVSQKLPSPTFELSLPFSVQKYLAESEILWETSVRKRHAEVERSQILRKIVEWGEEDFVLYWDYFTPAFNCPHHLERIGRIGDGGKWVCGFSLFEKNNNVGSPCVLYSFGIGYETTFESEFFNRTNCQIWAYDFTVKNMNNLDLDTSLRVHFKNDALGTYNHDQVHTLKDFMKRNGHEWIDILKADVEGEEFNIFNQIMKDFEELPFGQLLIELHLHRIGSFKEFYEWWERLEGKGLRAVILEPNNYAFSHQLKPWFMEVVFLNVKAHHKVTRSSDMKKLKSA